jgi:hypothetical protein
MKMRSIPAIVRRRGMACLVAMLAVWAGGCSSAVEQRADAWGGEGATKASRRPMASQGGSWELVFASPGVNSRLAGSGEGPEFGRLDASLNPRGGQPVTALSSWPEAPRPDLARARSVRVRDNESTFIYYLPTGSRGGSNTSDTRSGWWY